MSEQTHIRPYSPKDKNSVIALWETVFPNEPSWNDPENAIDLKLRVQKELFLVCVLTLSDKEQVVGTTLAGYAIEDRVSLGKRLLSHD